MFELFNHGLSLGHISAYFTCVKLRLAFCRYADKNAWKRMKIPAFSCYFLGLLSWCVVLGHWCVMMRLHCVFDASVLRQAQVTGLLPLATPCYLLATYCACLGSALGQRCLLPAYLRQRCANLRLIALNCYRHAFLLLLSSAIPLPRPICPLRLDKNAQKCTTPPQFTFL